MVTLLFNLKGTTSLWIKEANMSFDLATNQHNMFYGNEADGKMKVDKSTHQLFTIQFTKDSFLKIANEGNDTLKRFADKVLEGKTASLSKNNLNIDIGIQSCIKSALNCRYSEDLKKIFLSKAIEMLVLQAESFNQFLTTKPSYVKTSYDKERIIYAKDYIIQHIESPPTLSELARIAGINEFKLKKGFKEIFGTTVFGYLTESRLELAKMDLQENKKTISEIAFELGYSSVQHFSNAFKKKFGVARRRWK
jgi:AraC family transcriptional regulator, transcriptional activator of the genes for pyochelin and ferripyochelin receptors